MNLSTLKPLTCWVPLVTGGNGSNPNASKVTLVNRQALPAVKVQIKYMKEREQPLLQEGSAVSSRREMMHLTAVSICFPSLFFPATAEARPGDATITEKITGKVEELKEKAGSSLPKLEDLKGKAGSSVPNLEDLKGKAGSSVPKLEDLKGKAGSSVPNLEDLKGKAGLPTGKVEDLKEKVGMANGKVEELKEKAGLSKPKLEELKGKAGLSKPKDEGKNSKPINEMYGSKAKSIYGVAGTNPGGASQQTLAQAPQKEPSVPTLQTLPPSNFLIG